MKKLIIICLITLVSCSTTNPRKPASEAVINEELIVEINEFQSMVEEMLVWRTKALTFAGNNAEKLKKEKLAHKDIETIHASAKEYVRMREKLLSFAFKYQMLVSDGTMTRYSPAVPSAMSLSSVVNSNGENKNYAEYKINPNDDMGKDLLLKTRLSLNAALVLYDSYMVGLYPYYNSRKMRKLLNQDIKGFRFEFDKITDSFFDVIQRNRMYNTIQLFKKDLSYKENEKMEVSKEEKYLDFLALQSPFYNFMNEKYKPLVDAGAFRIYFDRIFDRSRFLNDFFVYSSSKAFGNAVGLISFRKGLMTRLSENHVMEMKSTMKPLDILLEKTPFRLTDQFIPGFYGHVALWVGTEAELKELNLWEHPLIAPHQEAIRNGHHIIEALRPGVQINTLEHFINIDDMLVLRDESLNLEQQREFLIRAFAQIGKAYDFNFDVETDNQIVCSEIVYVVFHNIDWPTKKALGRHTISPDNVASKVFDGGILKPILMYSNGKKVEGDLTDALAKKL